jgi:NAD(P)-dependent dehydrogenase (short-subunit alcohol dehydrogenase family)
VRLFPLFGLWYREVWPEDLDRMLDVNVRGVFVAIQVAARLSRRSGLPSMEWRWE